VTVAECHEVIKEKSRDGKEQFRAYNGRVHDKWSHVVCLGPIVMPALCFIGPKLPDQVIRSLFELMSTCGWLLNDIQGFQVLCLKYSQNPK